MNRSTVALAAAAVALAGCAAPDIDQAVRDTDRSVHAFTGGSLQLSRTQQERSAREAIAARLLSGPLGMDDAVRLALSNSPAVQATLAQRWNDMALAGQSARIANPVFTFDRLRDAGGLSLDRLLSVGLLDLLTLPRRQAIARNAQAQARTQLAIDVVDQVNRVRAAWVRAVASQQRAAYALQVKEAAAAGAELARRMQEVGNFSKLQRAREQAFYADAATQVAASVQSATAAREELVRLLGLTEAQAAALQLPDRLPELPAAPRAIGEVTAAAIAQRLDVQLARQQLETAGQAQGLALLDAIVDTEVGVQHNTLIGSDGRRETQHGYELAVRVPLFDWGQAQRAAMNAQSLAAANRYDNTVRAAGSHVRQSYGAYRSAYDIAKHYRDEVVPLRKTISEENMLRYNGMLIGVFDLLADARNQIAAVSAAIEAQQQFWLAEAALSSTLVGKPAPVDAPPLANGPSAGADPAAH
ncbi:TolC family protein [Ramlibacter sp.]|uniref:TolC family protein n=1 Tax=Ramlibacter sp. TaxID=1917967 RepID=UPI002CDB3734|nr:TolC family protein [Ramlibacter sp.]HWI83692.1 TolC family protein [Ramlibacter sp.]